MRDTFIIFNTVNVVVQVDGVGYFESYENFMADYGKPIEYELIDYSKTYGYCSLNGEPEQPYPNELCEDILDNFQSLMDKKYARENPPLTFEQQKEVKIYSLKENRDFAEQLPVKTDVGVFDVDDKSITRITNAKEILTLTKGTIDWTLADNTIAKVTAEDLQNVIFALAQQSNEVHERYRILKEQVLSCESIDELERIEW